MPQPERVDRHKVASGHDAAARAGADIGEILQRLDRLFSDTIAYLEGSGPADAQSGSASDGGEPTSPEPRPVLAMLQQQQVLLEALEREIEQGRTGKLTAAQLEEIIDHLEQRNLHCRRLLRGHLQALERRLAAGQRRQDRSQAYRAHQSGVTDLRPPPSAN